MRQVSVPETEEEGDEEIQGKIMRQVSVPETEEEGDDTQLLQTKSNFIYDDAYPNLENQINSVKNSGGSVMDGSTRQFMESRFGNDFGNVKIHTGSQSSELNRAVNSRAFTTAAISSLVRAI